MRFRLGLNLVAGQGNLERAFQQLGNISDIGDDWIRIAGMEAGAADGGSESGAAWSWERKLRVDLPNTTFIAYGPYGIRGLDARWEGAEHVTMLTRFGWNVGNIHSVGDRATSTFLDAFEEAKKRGLFVEGSRLTIDHLLMVRPQDIIRMKELEVWPNIAPWFFLMPPNDDVVLHQYGEERMNKMMPVKSYIDAGIKPSGGADIDTRPYRDPLWVIEKFVTRKDGKGRVWNPEEKVTRQQALWMMTNWAAYAIGDQKKLGTIESGKLADLVVLDGDYMTVPEEEISKIPVVMTVVGGKVIYERPGQF